MAGHRVIIFVFAGRQGNMALQVPMIKRILADHPNAEYHVWNLTPTTKNDPDNAYLQDITGDRITVLNDFHGTHGSTAFKNVYRYYGHNTDYADCLFVKLDDDIVFLQTQRFGAFIAAIDAHRDYLVSANVVNNGACSPLTPALWEGFESLNVPLLDIHRQNEYAEIAHSYFFEHYQDMLAQPIELIPTEDWLSINAFGFDWQIAHRFANELGTVPHPTFIAGRNFPLPWGLADEGMANLLPRMIMRGFIACHLTFGPQHCTGEQCTQWRKCYAEIGQRYLEAKRRRLSYSLPELSPVQCMFRGAPNFTDTGERYRQAGENDPCVGRFRA